MVFTGTHPCPCERNREKQAITVSQRYLIYVLERKIEFSVCGIL